jgi:3-oxoacyl-[acyl-carrier-protein] synthase-3
VPDRVLTNADLEEMVDTSDAWITERTGIKERRIADEQTATSDLGAEALKRACEQAEIELDSLDVVIVATSTPDTVFPSTACWVQHKLQISGTPVFDVSAGCTGWLYALEVASNLLAGGTGKRIGVIGAEVMSKVIDWTDRGTCVLFGDGAGAAIIESTDGDAGMLASNWGADGTLAPILYQPAGGTRKPATLATVEAREHSVAMQGNAVFKHAVRAMSTAAVQAIEAAGLAPEEIDLLIPHQANLRIMEACRVRTNVPAERMYVIVERYGNMSAATIPVALHEARAEGRLGEGSILAMTAFGTGLTWAASVLRI